MIKSLRLLGSSSKSSPSKPAVFFATGLLLWGRKKITRTQCSEIYQEEAKPLVKNPVEKGTA
jgi:hypothetical protein